MIVYDRLWITLKKKNISQYALIKDYGIDKAQLQRLRKNMVVKTVILNRLCSILDCKIEDIMDCQHFFRQIFLGYFSDIVQAFDTLRTNVCGDDYTSLHNPIVLSSVLPAYGMFHSIQILFL